MIGQKNLINHLEELFDKEAFPRFCILTGIKGSGKKLLIHEVIYPRLAENGYQKYILEDVKVDSVREMISMAHKLRSMFFVITDADSMSPAAQNAMLKLVEECPGNNYFILTLQDSRNILDTIRSRAQIFSMDIYTHDELKTFVDDDNVADICETPGEVELLKSYGINEFLSYTSKVIDNIATSSGANSFKIAEKVSMKDDAEGYDLKLFWKAFANRCVKRAVQCFEADDAESGIMYMKGVRDTLQKVNKLPVKGINKQMLFDMWILDIRKEWMKWM